jgi:hypothetical protein
MVNGRAVTEVIADAKRLEQEYRLLTGRPLGVTGEVAEQEACQLLGLTPVPPRNEGYDAEERADGGTRKLQIKSRCLADNKKPGRLGSINTEKD